MSSKSLVAPGVWRINDDFVSAYLIEGTQRSAFVDAGVGGLNLRAIAAELGAKEPMLAVTHADGDHIGDVGSFPGFRMHPSDFWYLAKHLPNARPEPIWEGETLELGGRTLEAIHIPGHTPGGLVFLDRANRLLFAGDAVQLNTPIFLFGDARNIPAFIAGLERLHNLSVLFDDIYPGHGQAPLHPADILRIIQACRLLLDGKLTPEAAEPGLPCRLYRHEDVQLYA